ncbi:hypothetical protein KMU_09840 [Proteus vulgaris]|nr:hypothetical protein KMU_09840 [Proteus vulgaris]
MYFTPLFLCINYSILLPQKNNKIKSKYTIDPILDIMYNNIHIMSILSEIGKHNDLTSYPTKY